MRGRYAPARQTRLPRKPPERAPPLQDEPWSGAPPIRCRRRRNTALQKGGSAACPRAPRTTTRRASARSPRAGARAGGGAGGRAAGVPAARRPGGGRRLGVRGLGDRGGGGRGGRAGPWGPRGAGPRGRLPRAPAEGQQPAPRALPTCCGQSRGLGGRPGGLHRGAGPPAAPRQGPPPEAQLKYSRLGAPVRPGGGLPGAGPLPCRADDAAIRPRSTHLGPGPALCFREPGEPVPAHAGAFAARPAMGGEPAPWGHGPGHAGQVPPLAANPPAAETAGFGGLRQP